jgi:hypothetical protein
MSTIRPTSADDCRTFIRQYQEEIKARKYDIVLSSEWVPYLSAEEILLLAHSCPSSRGVIAKHPRTSENVLHLLIQDYECAFAAAQNPGLPASVADILSRYHDKKVRIALVRNQNTPVHIVERIARSAQEHEVEVKAAAAASRSASADLLALLANDRSWQVRSSVARHPDTPVAVLVTLAENIRDDRVAYSDDGRVANNLVENPNTPTEALVHLAGIDGLFDLHEYIQRIQKKPQHNSRCTGNICC